MEYSSRPNSLNLDFSNSRELKAIVVSFRSVQHYNFIPVFSNFPVFKPISIYTWGSEKAEIPQTVFTMSRACNKEKSLVLDKNRTPVVPNRVGALSTDLRELMESEAI